jgi:hypothetical protein
MTQFTRPHLFDFYEMVLEQPEEQERLTAIASYILSKRLTTIANRQVQSAVRSARKFTSKDITPVFEQLEAMGWLFKGAPLRAGAPPIWHVNPRAHVFFAERAAKETERRAKIHELIRTAATARRHDTED